MEEALGLANSSGVQGLALLKPLLSHPECFCSKRERVFV